MGVRYIAPILTFILLAVSSFTLSGQNEYAAAATQRVALVIGNSDYDAGPLLNPENDARSMAKALRATDFEVLEHINLENQADMKRAIREFGRKIQNGGVGLFYYAGHGIQVDGKNYLVPTKAQIYAEEEVEYESVDVGFVLSQMEIARNRMNILILDACRNNPFARSWRSSATGLAFINAPAGTLIAYSTAPGSVASDGTGSNGLYTEKLLKQIRRRGLKIEDVFKNVRSDVLNESNRMQTPWESSSLVGDFYFIRPEAEILETRVEDVIPEIIKSTDRAEWKVTDGNYFFYVNGVDITKNTVASGSETDVLVFDNISKRNYLLKDYRDIREQEMRQADELFSLSNAFWKVNDENWFWFYLEGKEITGETNNAYYGNNLVVYHKQGGKYYVMNDYVNAEPGKMYQAVYVFTPNNTLWWADEKHYYLYSDGVQIAARTWSTWNGNDLIVHDIEAFSSYLLKDYYNHTDQALRPAEILYAPGLITCSKDQGQYFLYKEDKPYYMGGTSAYSEQDLLIYDTVFRQTVRFEDFLSFPDNTRIVGKTMYSRNNAFWRRKDNIYYLYIEGVLQVDDMCSSSYNGNDLEVFQNSTGITWVLNDYVNRNDNTLRSAEIK